MGQIKYNIGKDIINEMCDMYKSGIPAFRIGKKYDIPTRPIVRILKLAGLDIVKTDVNTLILSDRLKVCQMYSDGLSSTEISKAFLVSRGIILTVLKTHGIQARSISDYKRKYPINEKFFDVIDTPEKAWVLGLWFSDGCVNSNCTAISIGMIDADTINKIKDCFEYSGKVYVYLSDIRKTFYNLYICSNKLRESLISHGCTPRKSNTLQFPTTVPEHLMSHFIRGVFDGDGSIVTMNSIHISYKSLPALYHYLYDNTTESIRMDRKFNKFDAYIKSLVKVAA